MSFRFFIIFSLLCPLFVYSHETSKGIRLRPTFSVVNVNTLKSVHLPSKIYKWAEPYIDKTERNPQWQDDAFDARKLLVWKMNSPKAPWIIAWDLQPKILWQNLFAIFDENGNILFEGDPFDQCMYHTGAWDGSLEVFKDGSIALTITDCQTYEPDEGDPPDIKYSFALHQKWNGSKFVTTYDE